MKATIWSKYHCPYCDQAKALLNMKGIAFEEIKIDEPDCDAECLSNIRG